MRPKRHTFQGSKKIAIFYFLIDSKFSIIARPLPPVECSYKQKEGLTVYKTYENIT